jgi:predicted ATP-grasp superfamily ATP-dependent carboligase
MTDEISISRQAIPNHQAMVLAVNPIINAWSDEMIEQFYVNNVLPFDRRSIKEIMNDDD